MTETDIVGEFLSAMHERGIIPCSAIIADGKLHRIQLDGDKKGSKNGWYVVHVSDGHPAGAFGCAKRYGVDTKFTWKSGAASNELTPEERRAWRKRMNERHKQQAAEQAAKRDAAAARAIELWTAAAPAPDDHPYLKRKGVRSHGLRVGKWTVSSDDRTSVVSSNALLIPIRYSREVIGSLQAIFPDANNFLKRDKDYLKDGAKSGLYYSIGAMVDGVIIICEGYATGASIHEATGHLVVVAFDASNLKPVAERMRGAFKDAIIIIAADNDQWTLQPINNPGVTRALEASDAFDALVVIPSFADISTKPTDFNDLAQLEGLDTVKRVFQAEISQAKVSRITRSQPPAAEMDIEPAEPSSIRPVNKKTSEIEKEGNFHILGYDQGTYYIFSHAKSQVMAYTKSDFGDNGWIEIADINVWTMRFRSEKGIDKKAAFNWLVAVAHSRGIFDMERIRGRGVWTDEGRSVFHHGESLSVDGQLMQVMEIESRYVYQLAKSLPIPADEMLTDEAGKQLLDISKMFRWTKPASAALLAGWVMLSSVCGALRWRPHIWITGGPGSGKSSIFEEYINPLLQGMILYAQGNSTEAGIRQTLKADALPVILDEAESNEDADKRRVQNIISMIRQSSSESHASVLKGSSTGHAMRYQIRSMWCLSSVQVALKNQADLERLTVLNLGSKTRGSDGDGKQWGSIKSALQSVIAADRQIAGKLLRRAIDLLPVIQQNIKTFSVVCADNFGTQREGDQYGALLAGTWTLISSKPATADEALKLVQSYDWSEHREQSDADESMRALVALSEAHVRSIGGAEVTVYELVCAAVGISPDGNSPISADVARRILLRHGLTIEERYLLLSNDSRELKRLFEGSAFEADARGLLLRLPGADRNNNKTVRFSGVSTKCIRIPLTLLLEDEYKKWMENVQ